MMPVSQMETTDSEAEQVCCMLSEKLRPNEGAKESVDQEDFEFLIQTIIGKHYYYYGHILLHLLKQMT